MLPLEHAPAIQFFEIGMLALESVLTARRAYASYQSGKKGITGIILASRYDD